MIGQINVSNGYHIGFDKGIYIGRSGKGKQGSPLANPFTLQQYNREECLNKYRSWLIEHLNDINSPQTIELNRLTELVKSGQDINLICFCKPKDCHGDIIKELILEEIKK